MKRNVNTINTHVIYELPHELLNDFRLRILENKKILTKSQIFIEWYPSTQYSQQNEKFVNTSEKNDEK